MTAGGDHAERVKRITITNAGYGDQRLIASSWAVNEHGRLVIIRDHVVIAEFAPGSWAGIIDEQHRDPDCLRIARDGLDEIRHAIRQVPLRDYGDEDPLILALRQVDEIADRAKTMSYLHNHSEPF